MNKLLLFIIGTAVGFSRLSFAGTSNNDVSHLLATLAQRPGVHVVVDFRPSVIISWVPHYQPALDGINAQRLRSDNPEQREKLAAYLTRGDNACALKTLQSLNALLAAKGDQFDTLSKNIYVSTPSVPGKPALQVMQTITVGSIFFPFVFDEDIERLLLYGCQPGTYTKNGGCETVHADFDYSTVAYKYPIRDISVGVPTLANDSKFIVGNGAKTSNQGSTGLSIERGNYWEFDNGAYSMGEIEKAFYQSLRDTNQVPTQATLESRCEVGPGLLALLFGKTAEDVKAGFRIP